MQVLEFCAHHDIAAKNFELDREPNCTVEVFFLFELRCDSFNGLPARGLWAHEELVVQVPEEPCAQKRLGTWPSTQAHR
jgi:hypothetical protein